MNENIWGLIAVAPVFTPTVKGDKTKAASQVHIYSKSIEIIHDDNLSLQNCLILNRAMTVEEQGKHYYSKDDMGDANPEYALLCKYKGLYYRIGFNEGETVHIMDSGVDMLVITREKCRIYELHTKKLKFAEEFSI